VVLQEERLKKIKLYGERNCGTNYFEQLIDNNLNVNFVKNIPPKFLQQFFRFERQTDWFIHLNRKKGFGWKHGIPHYTLLKNRASEVAVICLVKNPYSFLHSLFKRPYHYQGQKPNTFEAFLKQPWQCIPRDNSMNLRLDNPVKLWNLKTAAYLNTISHLGNNSMIVKYEDLLKDPSGIVKSIQKKFSLESKREVFENISQASKQGDQDYAFYKDYYLNNKWLEKYNPESLQFVNQQLDKTLMRELEYALTSL